MGNKAAGSKFKPFIPWIIVAGCILLILGGICLKVFLFDGFLSKTKLVYSDGKYYDGKNGITYVAAPHYYEPVLIAHKFELSSFSRGNGSDLFRVGYRDSENKVKLVKSSLWLATDKDHGLIVYYNEKDAVCPEPEDFEPEYIYLTTLSSTELPTQKLDLATTGRLMREFFAKDESENLYDSVEFEESTCIKGMKITSKKYPWLYLNMYLYHNDGKFYVFFPAQKKFCETDATVFEIYFAIPQENEN